MRIAVAVFALALVPASLRADESGISVSPPRELSVDLTVDGAVTGVSVLTWVALETVLKRPLAPASCHWCEPPAIDRDVRAALRWENTSAAGWVGDSGLLLAPIMAWGGLALASAHDNHGGVFWENSLLVLESVGFAMLLTNGVKLIVGRERPVVHFDPERASQLSPPERNLSFFSGHSSYTFAFAVSAGTIASLRGYRWARWVWTAGLALAAVTAYSRIGADRHYFTDVLTGAVVGTGVGFAVPWFFHQPVTAGAVHAARSSMSPRIVPVPMGQGGGGIVALGWL